MCSGHHCPKYLVDSSHWVPSRWWRTATLLRPDQGSYYSSCMRCLSPSLAMAKGQWKGMTQWITGFICFICLIWFICFNNHMVLFVRISNNSSKGCFCLNKSFCLTTISVTKYLLSTKSTKSTTKINNKKSITLFWLGFEHVLGYY